MPTDRARFTEVLLRFHRPTLWLAQTLAFTASIVGAFLLRFDLALPQHFHRQLLFALLVWPLLKLVVYALFGSTRGWWRYVALSDVLQLIAVNGAASLAVTIVTVLFGTGAMPRSIYPLDFLVCVALTCALRVSRQAFWVFSHRRVAGDVKTRVFIYGAGDAGVSLYREIRQNPSLPYQVAGFIDDDPNKRGMNILGRPVLGGGDDLTLLVQRHTIETVLVALPGAGGAAMTRVLRACQAAGVAFKTVPSMGEILAGAGLATQIRNVAVEDVLGRAPVRLDQERIQDRLAGRTVLVSGAAGSIGSELCRQIAAAGPAALVALDISETGLFNLERNLAAGGPGVPVHLAIGNVADPARVGELLAEHNPDIVFHAAAYKHVPLMESHLFEAVANNVFGVATLASACARHGVADFVMISSDKAVRPTNVMGVTKRVCELVVASQPGRTKFVSVRFGNVLDSNGSVVPIFKRQIAAGGPVTVTHPQIQRFFMTIPEAAQLVLEALTLGRHREIFVLDMGQPIPIVELARNLILLHGLRPDEDIRIEFTGLRPGEKLYEELSFYEEGTQPTAHEKIRVFAGQPPERAEVDRALEDLKLACRDRDASRTVLVLKDLVPEYNPSSHLLRRMLGTATARAGAASG